MNSHQLPLNMSIVSAFHALNTINNSDHVQYLKKNDPTLSHVDWNSFEFWESKLDKIIFPADIESVCRHFCYEFILSKEYFLKLTKFGRQSLISNLNADEIQVFRNGKLLEKNPQPEIVIWWDNLKNISRSELNSTLSKQGRLAEEWTLNIELEIVKQFTSLEPEWISIDSDHYGYDIKSYRKNEQGEVWPIQIEVKSYLNSLTQHFYFTSNEWTKALLAESSYFLYLWCMETKEYQVLTLEQIKHHIPDNNGFGSWQSVLIEFN